MKPSHEKYVREGKGKHRGGRIEKAVAKPKHKRPVRNTKLIVADQVGSMGPGRF